MFGLKEKRQKVDEKLVGGQKKLDKDKRWFIDGKDFVNIKNKKKWTKSTRLHLIRVKDKKDKKLIMMVMYI